MSWPRFRLTPEESKYSIKYEDPSKKQRGVLRRVYAGELNFSSVIRQDKETIKISRRSRIIGFTASGDVHLVEIQMSDVTGEQYTTDFTPISELLCGFNIDPRGASSPVENPNFITPGYFTGATFGNNFSLSPYIFEPNVVLAPNQTFTIDGRPIDPELTDDMHVSLCFHVVEFPGMPGSPL